MTGGPLSAYASGVLRAAFALLLLAADPTAPFVSDAGAFSALFPGPVRE